MTWCKRGTARVAFLNLNVTHKFPSEKKNLQLLNSNKTLLWKFRERDATFVSKFWFEPFQNDLAKKAFTDSHKKENLYLWLHWVSFVSREISFKKFSRNLFGKKNSSWEYTKSLGSNVLLLTDPCELNMERKYQKSTSKLL